MSQGKIIKVAGPLIVVENMQDAKMFDVVRIGEKGLVGEIIEMRGDKASVQVYEETGGLGPGDKVISTNEPLSVELAPGLIEGIYDGIPICLGYISVAFAFGIFATGSGLSVYEALLISMLNVTSAGQLAAVPIIAGGGTLIELTVAQLVINLRYSFMSVALSQKTDSKFKGIFSFGIIIIKDSSFLISG